MYSLEQRGREWGTDDRRWLRDLHGLNHTLGATLDGDAFGAGDYPDGVVLSGTVVAQDGADRLWRPFAAVTNPAAVGHLAATRLVRPGARTDASVLTHGGVIRNYLPANSGMTDAVVTALPGIRYTVSEGVI